MSVRIPHPPASVVDIHHTQPHQPRREVTSSSTRRLPVVKRTTPQTTCASSSSRISRRRTATSPRLVGRQPTGESRAHGAAQGLADRGRTASEKGGGAALGI